MLKYCKIFKKLIFLSFYPNDILDTFLRKKKPKNITLYDSHQNYEYSYKYCRYLNSLQNIPYLSTTFLCYIYESIMLMKNRLISYKKHYS